MPAGVSWSKYIGFSMAAMLSMFLGAQTVHAIYRPLDDLDEVVNRYRQEASLANVDNVNKADKNQTKEGR